MPALGRSQSSQRAAWHGSAGSKAMQVAWQCGQQGNVGSMAVRAAWQGGGVGAFATRNQQVTMGHYIKATSGRLVLGPFRILFLCVEG